MARPNFTRVGWLLASIYLANIDFRGTYASFTDGEVVKILFVGDEFLLASSAGLDVPNVTASVLDSLTPRGSPSVQVSTYAVKGYDWADHVEDADKPGNALFDLLGAGANETWDYVIFQEDSQTISLTVTNSTLAAATQSSLQTLIDMAILRNASSVVILPPAYLAGDVAYPQLLPNFGVMQNSSSYGAVALTDATTNATGHAISIAPVGLSFASIFDLAKSSILKAFSAQLPVGSSTPAYLYLPASGGKLPSVFGSYLVGNTLASTLTGCKVVGKGYIPAGLVGTLWPNLLQSASDNIVFSPIYNPPGFPHFPWANGSGPCQTTLIANGR